MFPDVAVAGHIGVGPPWATPVSASGMAGTRAKANPHCVPHTGTTERFQNVCKRSVVSV